MSCIFCDFKEKTEQIIYENEKVFCIYDNYPVTRGHILIISKKHKVDYFALDKQELVAIDEAIRICKSKLDDLFHPSGYNIGINNGRSAGQTIMHLHVHLIPRYDDLTIDPKGGVRGVIPERQKY